MPLAIDGQKKTTPFEHLDAQGRAVVQALLSDETKTRLCIVHGEDSVPRANRRIEI